MKTIEITHYHWITLAGGGHGRSRTEHGARKAAMASARKLAREHGCPDNPPAWRVYKRTIVRKVIEQVGSGSMKNYHGKEEKIEAGEYVFHVTDQGEIVRAYVERVDGEILELAFSDSEFGCELISTCFRDENQAH